MGVISFSFLMALTAQQLANMVRNRPKIGLNKTYSRSTIVARLSEETGLSPKIIRQVLDAEAALAREAITEGAGFPVAGLGSLFPKINLEGVISVGFRQRRGFKKELNTDGFFQGTILNKKNIGRDARNY